MSGRGSGNTICNNANCTTRRRRSVVIALGKWLHKQQQRQQQPLKPQQRRLLPHKLRDRERQFHVVSDVAFVLGVHAAAEEAAAAEGEQQL